MLDECKGDRFFEVLALFSTVVLKKALASRPAKKKRTAVARRLATTTNLPGDAQASLLPLAIAHKAALVNILKRKDEKRIRFADFERLLNAKADDINQRIRKCRETPRAREPAIPQKEAAAIKKQLKDNWIGNQKWLEVMLHGEDVQAEDAFLNSSFNRVWNMVEQGRKLEGAVPEVGLLENLQTRVQEQQARLQKWQMFHEKLRKEEPIPSFSAAKPEAPTREFKFEDHLKLQPQAKIPEHEPVKRPPLRAEYRDIISEMDDELARVATAKHIYPSDAQVRRRGSSLAAPTSPTRRRKSRSDSVPKVPASPGRPTKPAPPLRKQSKETIPTRPPRRHEATPVDSETTLVGHLSTVRPVPQASRSVLSLAVEHQVPLATEETSDALPTTSSPPRPFRLVEPLSPSPSPPPPSSYFPSEPPVLEPPQINTEDALAAQIISTIGDVTPSPVKKQQPRLSLMERTRLSMAPRNSTFQSVPESPSLPSPPLPEPPTIEPPQLDRRASLLERTRLNMAAMSAKPRASLAPKDKKNRKSSARQSIYPTNQFDTPRTRRSIQAIEEAKSGEHTPKEELFSEEVEYERVFKSRPRIATSPVWGTPQNEGMTGAGEVEGELDEGVTGVDLGDVDQDEDEDGFTQAWENSPLRRAGRGKTFG